MKRLMTLATLALLLLSTVSFAQQQEPSVPQQQPSQTQPSTGAPSQAAQAVPFSGTVVKEGDKYVLQSSGITYQLDDQAKAKHFEGQRVTVNGDLDKTTRTIRVSNISPAK